MPADTAPSWLRGHLVDEGPEGHGFPTCPPELDLERAHVNDHAAGVAGHAHPEPVRAEPEQTLRRAGPTAPRGEPGRGCGPGGRARGRA